MVLLLVFSSVNHREEPPLKQGDEPSTKEKKNSHFIAFVQSQNKINNIRQKAMKQGGDFTCAKQAGLFQIHHEHLGT